MGCRSATGRDALQKIREYGPAPQHRTSRRCPFGQNAGSRKREMYRFAIQGKGDFHSAEAVTSNCFSDVSAVQGMATEVLLFDSRWVLTYLSGRRGVSTSEGLGGEMTALSHHKAARRRKAVRRSPVLRCLSSPQSGTVLPSPFLCHLILSSTK